MSQSLTPDAPNLPELAVLVLGMGESGCAMAGWCVREGARVRVADTRNAPPGGPRLMAEFPTAEIHCGGLPLSLLDGIDVLAISPGLAPTHAPQADLLQAARERGIPLWGELEFFARKLDQLRANQGYQPDILAITGTNGKTTVTRLTGALCTRAGKRVAVAGNISPAALDALREALDSNALPDVWVLELSSFQLELAGSFTASAATVLNLTQDHLDWHETMDAYAAAKSRIFAPGTTRILNRDDARVMAMAPVPPPPVESRAAGRSSKSRAAVAPTPPLERVITFGKGPPEDGGDGQESFGIVRENGMRWLAQSVPVEDESMRRGRRKPGAAADLLITRLMPADAMRIRGDHNATNALAALALCRAIGLPMAPMLHGLREFHGEPHRTESIATLDGVEFVDDSKGTNVGATLAALDGLGARVVLIAGGEGKGQDFAPLAPAVARAARAVLLIGRDAPLLRAALRDSGVPLIDCASLEEAVAESLRHAQSGDVVLLSPACASFDMFRDYKDRGERFTAAVRECIANAGQPC